MGESAAELRSTLRGLVQRELPADYLGAFTTDPSDLEVAQRFCKLLAEEHLLAVCVAHRIRWRGRFDLGADGRA